MRRRTSWAQIVPLLGFLLLACSSGFAQRVEGGNVAEPANPVAGNLHIIVQAMEAPPVTSMAKPAVTVAPIEPTFCPAIQTQCPTKSTVCPPVATNCPAVQTSCPTKATLCPATSTQCPST